MRLEKWVSGAQLQKVDTKYCMKMTASRQNTMRIHGERQDVPVKLVAHRRLRQWRREGARTVTA